MYAFVFYQIKIIYTDLFFIFQFSALAYNRLVKPKQEVTFSYQFFVSEAYSPRPYGLTINLYYRDADNVQYLTPVFNETVNIFELDEGLDSETFFLFIVLAGLAVLALVGIYQLFQSYGVIIFIHIKYLNFSINVYFFPEKTHSNAIIFETKI